MKKVDESLAPLCISKKLVKFDNLDQVPCFVGVFRESEFDQVEQVEQVRKLQVTRVSKSRLHRSA